MFQCPTAAWAVRTSARHPLWWPAMVSSSVLSRTTQKTHPPWTALGPSRPCQDKRSTWPWWTSPVNTRRPSASVLMWPSWRILTAKLRYNCALIRAGRGRSTCPRPTASLSTPSLAPPPPIATCSYGDTQASHSWWRHKMETFSASLALCVGNREITGEFPSQMPLTRSSDVFFYLRPNKRLNKQSICRWFETSLRSLWRHCNVGEKIICWPPVTYFTKEVNPSLSKQPLKFNGRLCNLVLTCLDVTRKLQLRLAYPGNSDFQFDIVMQFHSSS